MEPGILILALTIVTFLAIFVFFFLGRKEIMPGGSVISFTTADGTEITLIFDKSLIAIYSEETKEITDFLIGGTVVSLESIKKGCEKAALFTRQLFVERQIISNCTMPKFVVLYLSDENFDKSFVGATQAGAFSGYIPKTFYGKGRPLITSRSRYIPATTTNGMPVVHELIHLHMNKAFEDFQDKHDDSRLWSTFGSESLESTAKMLCAESLKQ